MGVLEWAMLAVIVHHPGIDQSALSELVSIDRTNTGRLADLLESKRLIERRPSASDRRVWLLRCTQKGRKVRERLLPRALASQDLLLSGLSKPEQKQLIDLLFRLLAANEAYVRPGAGRRKRGSVQSSKQ
jgi:DNA-binding MarR family transcriptional regulator